jgi:quercetin dioxygenase-like cupin family protein
MNIITSTQLQEPSFTKETLGTFSGDVFFNHLHKDEHISILDVQFAPCARTHWHGHKNGQLLEITTGSGWLCDKGQEPRKVKAGDIVWCPPGTVHWHGAGEGESMVHRAFTYGNVDWHNPVSEDDLKGMN